MFMDRYSQQKHILKKFCKNHCHMIVVIPRNYARCRQLQMLTFWMMSCAIQRNIKGMAQRFH